MTVRRVAPYVVTSLLLGGLLSAPAAIAGPRHVSRPEPTPVPAIGHLAYLTKQQTVNIVAVAANGTTTAPKQVAPVTRTTGKEYVQIADLVASGDGAWLAWSESVYKPAKQGPDYIRSVLVMRNVADGHVVQLTTSQSPIGFAGDTLVTTNSITTDQLDIQPTPHLVKVKDNGEALVAYPSGVVDTKPISAPPGPKDTIVLRLTTFNDTHAVLHNYVLGPNDAHFPDLGWVSGDGKDLVIERGDHTDFGGIGPSSLADEYSLTNGTSRHQLGHFGTAKAAWRMFSVSFSGGSDKVWAVWYRATRHGATSVVTDYANGKWHNAQSDGIAVAGNQNGYVVVQAGKWVSVGVEVPEFDTVPTGDPLLVHAGSKNEVLDTPGTAFAWVD